MLKKQIYRYRWNNDVPPCPACARINSFTFLKYYSVSYVIFSNNPTNKNVLLMKSFAKWLNDILQDLKRGNHNLRLWKIFGIVHSFWKFIRIIPKSRYSWNFVLLLYCRFFFEKILVNFNLYFSPIFKIILFG